MYIMPPFLVCGWVDGTNQIGARHALEKNAPGIEIIPGITNCDTRNLIVNFETTKKNLNA
ncbi:MAG: hypothetical protein A2W85_18580 [Bacteroidetes bacterium GWF2_41_31]|nr:MAG: hypothetical protein A2W85_18580 [Bacteroidetes bacterium GWF2_41_31]OFZ09538.1 MAG: hypothetical protein A2338_02520 [Bacteroidetes bacterium RIFOXYB12_FULL_41_6]